MDVSLFKVVIVDLDNSVQLILLSVDCPLGLPLTTPACFKLQVDTRDVNLKISILIEAKASSCSSIAILKINILVNGSLYALSKQIIELAEFNTYL